MPQNSINITIAALKNQVRAVELLLSTYAPNTTLLDSAWSGLQNTMQTLKPQIEEILNEEVSESKLESDCDESDCEFKSAFYSATGGSL